MLDLLPRVVYQIKHRLKRACFFCRGIAQLVEHRSPKPSAEGSNPSAPARYADVAQVVAHILGKDEVTSSSLVISSKKMSMNGLFKLFMDIFVLFEKISALESESSA